MIAGGRIGHLPEPAPAAREYQPNWQSLNSLKSVSDKSGILKLKTTTEAIEDGQSPRGTEIAHITDDGHTVQALVPFQLAVPDSITRRLTLVLPAH